MKRRVYVILLLMNLVAVYLVIKLSALPVISFFPESFLQFWTTSSEQQQTYALIYDLAGGFILSTIFYIIVDELPERTKYYKVKKILSTRINDIQTEMETIISLIIQIYSLPKEYKALSGKDFITLNGDTKTTQDEISYVLTLDPDNDISRFHMHGTLDQIVKTNIKDILYNVTRIRNYESFYSSNIELMELMINIQECKFIKYYREDAENTKFNTCFIMADTSTAIAEFVDLYLKILDLKLHTRTSRVKLDSKAVTEQYKKDRESETLYMDILEKQASYRKSLKDAKILITSSNKYTSKIISNTLQSELIADYKEYSDVYNESYLNYKFVVMIIDEDSLIHLESMTRKIADCTSIIILVDDVVSSETTEIITAASVKVLGKFCFKSMRKNKKDRYINKDEPSEKTILELKQNISKLILG